MIEIKKRALFGGETIYRSETLTTVSDTITAFVALTPLGERANLAGADLTMANLYGKPLWGKPLWGKPHWGKPH